MQKPVLVIKLGTAVLTNERGEIVQATIKKVAAGIAHLSGDYRIILVSSGAVGSGRSFFSGYKGTLAERKAAAAVGNPILIRHYQKHFRSMAYLWRRRYASVSTLATAPVFCN